MFVYIRSAAFVIVVTQKLVLQQSKYVTAKCTETLSPPPSIQYLLAFYELKYNNVHWTQWKNIILKCTDVNYRTCTMQCKEVH